MISEVRDEIADANAVFTAVRTPTRRDDGHTELSYVCAAAEENAGLMNRYKARWL